MIAALEGAYPDPPLYPADPERAPARARAGGLLRRGARPARAPARLPRAGQGSRALCKAVMERTAPGPLTQDSRAAPPPTPASSPACAMASTTRRRRRWRGPRSSPPSTASKPSSARGDYLVGDSFSVADLTAAALFNPLVLPDGGPLPATEEPPAGHAELPRAAAASAPASDGSKRRSAATAGRPGRRRGLSSLRRRWSRTPLSPAGRPAAGSAPRAAGDPARSHRRCRRTSGRGHG